MYSSIRSPRVLRSFCKKGMGALDKSVFDEKCVRCVILHYHSYVCMYVPCARELVYVCIARSFAAMHACKHTFIGREGALVTRASSACVCWGLIYFQLKKMSDNDEHCLPYLVCGAALQ